MNRKVLDSELTSARRTTRRVKDSPEVVHPEIRLGIQLKHARLAKGLRLKALAALVGCTESFLSKLENDKARPSLDILHRIATALGINISRLLDADIPNSDSVAVTRASTRKMPEHRPKADLAVDHLAVGSRLIEATVQCLGRGKARRGAQHEGEALAYVISGEMELSVAGSSYRLAEGDTAFFPSSHPYRYRSCGGSKLNVLWVHTPPSLRS